MNFKGRRVLVTGGTGFIGSALAKRLLREGAEVHLLVRATSSRERLGPAWERCVRHVGSIEEPATVVAALKASRPEFVFHLARERDGASFERQAKATRALAAALKTHAPGLVRWVRTAHSGPKRGDDAALAAEAASLGLHAVTLELFLVYGPGQGPNDFPRNVLEGSRSPSLSGSVKDFVYIDDVVEAYMLAAGKPEAEGKTISIGTGEGRSEAEAVAIALRMMGSDDAPPKPAGGGEGHPADVADARRLLGWTPRVLLEQGLARLIAGGRLVRPDPELERRHMIPWLGASGKHASAPKAGAPWNLIASAAAHFSSGDAASAERAVESFIARMPGAAAGPVMKALLCAQRGDRAGVERWLEAAGPKGPENWALAVRGMMRARWGEDDAARRDLDATRRSERSAWAWAARADVDNRAGLYWRALTDLGHMRRVVPASPEPDSRAADIHLEQAQYEEAAACLARAAKLAPGDASLRRQRSRVYFVEGNLPAARREIDEACRLAPDDLSLREERLRLCVLLDDHAVVEELLALPWAPGVRDFWRAYVLCRLKKYDESVKLFAAAEAAYEDARAVAKAAFYRYVVRVISQAPVVPPPPPGRELIIMGMGFRHPYQVSVEVLWTLRSCEAFFSNLSDSTVSDLLGLYGVPLKTIVFRRSDGQSTSCARLVMKGMKDLGRGAVVTRGQPNYYGRLAYRLVQDSLKRGILCRIPPSVSIADFFPCLVGKVRGETLGLQIRDTSDMTRLDPRQPLVLYNFTSGSLRLAQCRALQGLYAPETPVWLMPGSGHYEYEPSETTVAALEPALMRADSAVTLLFPGA